MTAIETLRPDDYAAARDDLAAVLQACVADGASVGFVWPFPIDRARAFWDGVAATLGDDQRHVLIARQGERVVGTVQLVFARQDNGRHRAEVAKLLVHPDARRQGIAAALMEAIEAVARRRGMRLLVLDTGTPAAEALYRRLGFAVSGVVPNYAADVFGGFLATTFMHKELPADA